MVAGRLRPAAVGRPSRQGGVGRALAWISPVHGALVAKGLGGLEDSSVLPLLVPLMSGSNRMVAVEAIRAIGRLGGAAGGPALLALIQNPKADPCLRLEAMTSAASIPPSSVPWAGRCVARYSRRPRPGRARSRVTHDCSTRRRNVHHRAVGTRCGRRGTCVPLWPRSSAR